MRIRHKETNIEKSVEFGKWIREYVRTNLYKDWEILNLDNVVKVKTLFKDGKVSTTLMSRTEAENHKKKAYEVDLNIPRERVTMEFYEKYLEGKILNTQDYSKSSFLIKVKKVLKSIPKAKTIYESIINSTISKVTSNIVTGVIIGILILIIWSLYGNQIIEFLRKYV